ncbi:MAG TPA: hypothetical protein VLB75_02595 [Steroidobacteraceae bacterium]|nr:hypothetical protein [Steroidobacteraceae bacterium]
MKSLTPQTGDGPIRADASRAIDISIPRRFVPDETADGFYLLDLQLAPFVADATPSRPLLYPVIA